MAPTRQQTALLVRQCKHGLGAFATRGFRPGEVIARFNGQTASRADTYKLTPERFGDPLQIGDDRYLLLDEPYRSVNHSCNPNAGLTPELNLVAIRAIAAEEEVFYDYSTTMGDDNWSIRCGCGEASCRGEIQDFDELPRELREHYLKLGIVQRFLSERQEAG